LKRTDLAIQAQFTRTAEPGKDTILSIHFLFYAREGGKLIPIEERTVRRPREVGKPIKESMFEENSKFGQRYFGEWRKLGLSDNEIRQHIPKWVWVPEKEE
jgi:hypothetical protein